MKAKTTARMLAGTLVVTLGIGLVLYPTISDLRYALVQKGLEASAQAQAAGRSGIALPAGTVAKLVIRKIGLRAYVFPGTSQDMLAKGPGHYEETVLPGEKGNSGIAAHRTMHGHAFRRLDELAIGDKIVTYTRARKAVYRVFETKRVDPSDVSVIARTRDSRLTLTTCNPVGSARQRLAVVARLVK